MPIYGPMNAPWTPATDDTAEDRDLKIKFAGLLHSRPNTAMDRMAAAKLLFPLQTQTGLALTVATTWPEDPIVIAELDRLGSSGTDEGLPTKADMARRLVNLADNHSLPIEARLKAINHYTELMGMKPVPGAIGAGGIGALTVNRVFVLPAPTASLDDWEKQAEAQQMRLVNGPARRVEP
jgi:hypothetical protein